MVWPTVHVRVIEPGVIFGVQGSYLIQMKILVPFLALTMITAPALGSGVAPVANDSTGLPGDHFSLQGAIELFKSAKNLESFEQSLNAEGNHVNNLDLDGDGNVDYVRVIDHLEGEAHAITMQVALGKEEAQDVAVIELEKNGGESAVLQIRGAEDLYGSDVIVEPFEETEEAPQQKGPAAPMDGPHVRIWVNVWAWPCVMWMYGPTYVAWNSPWYWGYYPPMWRPWHPWGWNAWYGWHRPYSGWYHHVGVCRVTHAHAVYRHRAMHSPAVRQRTQAARTVHAANRAPTVRREQPVHNQQVSPRKGAAPQQAPSQPRSRRTPFRRSGGGRGTAPAHKSR